MMKYFRTLVCITTMVSFIAPEARAFTTNFFPGDSHFTTDLSQRSLKRIKTENGLQFSYYVIAGKVMFCGHAGFLNLNFEGKTAKLKANYLRAASILFEKFMPDIDSYGVPSLVEDDFFPVFVYNRDFDFKKYMIGPRYNENWENVQLDMFGLKHANYPGFDNQDLIYRDYRDAEKARPLELIQPLPKIRKFSPEMGIPGAISNPIQMEASKVQILILAGGAYEISKFAEKQPRRTLFRITDDSIERLETDYEGKWKTVPVDAPQNKETDKVQSTFKTLKAIGHALNLFGYRHGWRYPPPLSALVRKPSDFLFEKNEEDWMPFFKKIPVDGWGNAIMIPSGGNSLFSSGPDGEFYTKDDLIYSNFD